MPSNKRGEWIPEDEYLRAGGKKARPWQSLGMGTKAPTLPPKSALRLYRTLTAKQQAAPLTDGQSKALEQAERSLGQTFLFDDPNTSILKPAEDLVLERQTASRATFADSSPVQLALFMSSKRVVPEWIKPVDSLTINATLSRYGIQAANSFRNPRIAIAQLSGLPVTGGRGGPDGAGSIAGSEGRGGSGGTSLDSASPRGLGTLPQLDASTWDRHVRQIPAKDRRKGQEHTVYRHRDPRGDTAIKITNAGEFGARGSLGGYLEQMARQNEMFGDAIAIEGWLQFPGESGPRLVTSQPWQRGRHSTLEEIETYMRRKGFQRAYEGAWWNGSTVVSDALPKNFITATDGSVYPIDLVIETPSSQNRINQLDNQVASQDQPEPTPEPPALHSGTKALYPRETMPQIPTEQRPTLFRYLRALSIRLQQENVPPQSLRPSQHEIMPEMAARAAIKTEPRTIIISQDGYILDGHHQWQAALNNGTSHVSVIRVGLPQQGAIAALDSFPGNAASRPQESRFASEEYPYLGTAPTEWKTATDPEAAIVNPITAATTPDAQTAALMALSRDNIPLVESILSTLQTRLGLSGKWSLKEPARIMAKASRPIIRAEKPWHDIPHIRDGLRFKVTLDHFKKMPAIMRVLAENGVQVIKFDTAKMFRPKPWGWRFVAWDLKMPNGQLVEFYAPMPELEEAKAAGHLIFEKWRNLPMEDYTEEGAPRHAEYLADVRRSYELYADAFRRGLERMGYATETEAAAAWDSLVARASSVTMENFSMNSTGEGAPALRQTPSLPRRAPGGDTYASPDSSSSTANTSGAFMVEDSTDSDGNQAPSLHKSCTAFEPGKTLPQSYQQACDDFIAEGSSSCAIFPRAAPLYKEQIQKKPKSTVQRRILDELASSFSARNRWRLLMLLKMLW